MVFSSGGGGGGDGGDKVMVCGGEASGKLPTRSFYFLWRLVAQCIQTYVHVPTRPKGEVLDDHFFEVGLNFLFIIFALVRALRTGGWVPGGVRVVVKVDEGLGEEVPQILY